MTITMKNKNPIRCVSCGTTFTDTGEMVISSYPTDGAMVIYEPLEFACRACFEGDEDDENCCVECNAQCTIGQDL